MPALTAANGLAVTYRQQYRRCGSPRCGRCASGGPGHGPYWYAFWFEGGRARSRYIGKELPPDASGTAAAATAEPHAEAGEGDPETQPPRPGAQTATIAPLRVRTLGGFAVWRGEELIPATQWGRRKVTLLLKLLLDAPRQTLSTDQVVERLWPDTDPEQAAANLRSTVRFLRAVLDGPAEGSSYIRAGAALLVLDPAPGGAPAEDWLDMTTFLRQAKVALAGRDRAACRAALALYGGPYLPDDLYEDWSEERRTQLAQVQQHLLRHLAALAEREGEQDEAVWALRATLAADPGQEEAACSLMRLLIRQGRQSEALRVYQGLARTLRDELDMTPSPETEKLRATIRRPATTPVPEPAVPTNLPAALSRFIGREAELAALEHALLQRQVGNSQAPGVRLLTLTGIGGTGKTRLSLTLAGAVLDAYPDGVWLVELAPLAASGAGDPTPVLRAILAALDLREQAGASPLDAVIEHLRRKRLLLVLDNCEHVVAACATAAARLLAACTALQILATSREAMGMAGETVWPVPPLALPVAHAAGTVPLEQLARVESVQLLVARAQTIRPDFRLDAENAAAVVQVCRRLDGLPLAIELAAARLQSLTLHDLAARIDDRFRLLRRGDRSAQPRHQTLQAMMDWSYDLLDATERLVLRRLAVFAGGCTLAAAERVCSGDGVEEADVVDVLDELTRKSLIQADAGEAEATRYRLLEIVRHYAADRLVEANEQETLRARHLSWCLELADAAAPGLNGPQQSRWLAQLEAEHDNLRAALRWVLDAPDGDHLTAGLEVAGAIWRFWETRGYASEGRAWLDALLAHGPPASEAAAAARGRALLGAGVLAHVQGDYARAVAYQEEGLAIWRSLGDGPGLIASLNLLGIIAKSRGDYTRADEFYAEALTMARNLGQQGRIATLLGNMGTVARLQGDYVRATTLYEEALSIARARGDGQVVTRVLSYLAAVAGDTNEQQRAAALYRESLRQSWSLNDRRYIPICLEGLAGTVGGDSERTVDVVRNAVVLLACSAALRASLSTPLSPAEQAPVERTLAALRAALPDAQFAAAWAEGTALPLEEAINLALAGQP